VSAPRATHPALRLALGRVVSGGDLSAEEMAAALGAIMDGLATDAQIGALLTGLRMKGETVEEIVGAVTAMRARAVAVEIASPRLLDTCGTGGDGAGTFNVSTAVAFVCAAAGVRVAKHGNRAISSRVGSADVLEALGVDITLPPAAVARCVDTVGIGFMFAPAHHSALRHAAPARRELGFRTLLNLLGPMTNPAGATHQLVGLFDRAHLATVAEVLGRLGASRALVVHGCDGLDELTLAGPTFAAAWVDGAVRELTLAPEDFGLARSDASALAGGSAADNAALIRRVLAGAPGPAADIVRLNAGAALWVAEAAPDIAAGVARASEILASGAAVATLEALVAATRAR
jgi:anthranilate phosphoribosyltransferase